MRRVPDAVAYRAVRGGDRGGGRRRGRVRRRVFEVLRRVFFVRGTRTESVARRRRAAGRRAVARARAQRLRAGSRSRVARLARVGVRGFGRRRRDARNRNRNRNRLFPPSGRGGRRVRRGGSAPRRDADAGSLGSRLVRGVDRSRRGARPRSREARGGPRPEIVRRSRDDGEDDGEEPVSPGEEDSGAFPLVGPPAPAPSVPRRAAGAGVVEPRLRVLAGALRVDARAIAPAGRRRARRVRRPLARRAGGNPRRRRPVASSDGGGRRVFRRRRKKPRFGRHRARVRVRARLEGFRLAVPQEPRRHVGGVARDRPRGVRRRRVRDDPEPRAPRPLAPRVRPRGPRETVRARAGAAVALRVGREGEARRHTAVRLSRGHSRRTRLGRESGRPERRVPRRLPGRRAVRDSVGGGGEGARRGRGGFVFVHARVPSRRVPPRRRLRRRRRPSIVVVVVVHPAVGISRSVPGVGAERAVGGGGVHGARRVGRGGGGGGSRAAPARGDRSRARVRPRAGDARVRASVRDRRRGSSGTRGGGEGAARGGEEGGSQIQRLDRGGGGDPSGEASASRACTFESERFSPFVGWKPPKGQLDEFFTAASRPTPPGRGRRALPGRAAPRGVALGRAVAARLGERRLRRRRARVGVRRQLGHEVAAAPGVESPRRARDASPKVGPKARHRRRRGWRDPRRGGREREGRVARAPGTRGGARRRGRGDADAPRVRRRRRRRRGGRVSRARRPSALGRRR